MNTVFTKSYDEPPIRESEILRYSGTKEASSEVLSLMRECIDEARGLLSYKVCYIEVPIRRDGDNIILGTLATASKDLEKNLSGCEDAFVFAATVGARLDHLIKRYGTVSPAKAFMLGAYGAERIESLCDAFYDDILGKASESGKYLRPRFSPGYGDLPIEFQKEIFSVLDCPRKIGLSLNESLLMSPTKSVTAVIGIAPSGCEHKKECEACHKTDCAFRRNK